MCSKAAKKAANMCAWHALQCLQYQTDQIAELKKVEKLNDRFFALMARGDGATGAAQLFWLLCSLLSYMVFKLTRLLWGDCRYGGRNCSTSGRTAAAAAGQGSCVKEQCAARQESQEGKGMRAKGAMRG